MKQKYRIKEYDPIHDVWLLEKHVFWFIWKTMSAGSKAKIEEFIEKETKNETNS